MITQIEIDGFKTFKDFKVELAPFQVIVGPNGSGKSNLFDALHLLSRLAEDDLATAFQAVRGYTNELFTRLPGDESVNRMRFAVEMLVNSEVQDESVKVLVIRDSVAQKQNQVKYRRLRYELEIGTETDAYGLEKLYIVSESLDKIPQANDNWCRKYNLSAENGWLPKTDDRQEPFIATEKFFRAINGPFHHPAETPLITIFREAMPLGNTTQYRARDLNRTTLNLITGIDYLHIMAVREEMLSWRFVHLNPEALRTSSPALTHFLAFLSQDGRNLPTMLARMQNENEFALTDISRDMANLVPGISKVEVKKDHASNEYDIWIESSDQRTFSARALSDGTLRLLAIAAIRNDSRFHGVLSLEEPENGVEPLHLKTMAQVLQEMATDFSDPEQKDGPLRQVLITTHSPALVGLPEIIDFLLFAHLVTIGGSTHNNLPQRITRMEPVITTKTLAQQALNPRRDRATEVYTIDMIQQYIASDNLNSSANELRKARSLSIESNR